MPQSTCLNNESASTFTAGSSEGLSNKLSASSVDQKSSSEENGSKRDIGRSNYSVGGSFASPVDAETCVWAHHRPFSNQQRHKKRGQYIPHLRVLKDWDGLQMIEHYVQLRTAKQYISISSDDPVIYSELAGVTEGYSPSDLIDLVGRSVHIAAMRPKAEVCSLRRQLFLSL